MSKGVAEGEEEGVEEETEETAAVADDEAREEGLSGGDPKC